MYDTAKIGYLKVLEYTEYLEIGNHVAGGAVRHNQIHILDWLYDHHYQQSGCNSIPYWAIDSNNLQIFKWVHEKSLTNCKNSPKDCIFVSQFISKFGTITRLGRLNFLKWLNENCKIPFPEELMTIAARFGNLPILKFLYEIGTRYDKNNVMFAAIYGEYCNAETRKWICKFIK